MVQRRSYGEAVGDNASIQLRSRRARLTAEFEMDLDIDHVARAKAAAAAARWARIKTIIVWGVALIFFATALQMLWVLGHSNDRPLAHIEVEVPRWMDMPDRR